MNAHGFDTVKTNILTFPVPYLLLTVFVAFSRWFFEALALVVSLRSRYHISFWLSIKTSVITHFFNLITPFYSGGQPFAIYYLSKNGICAGVSTAAILMKSLVFQAVLGGLGFFGAIACRPYLNRVTLSALILGSLLNCSLFLLIFMFGLNRKLAIRTVDGFLLLLSKLKIVKNIAKSREKVLDKVHQFSDTFFEYRKYPWHTVWLVLCSLAQFFLHILSAAVILRGFGIHLTFPLFFQLSNMEITASVIPTPGTSGGIEYIFMLFLGQFGEIGKISAGLVLWRFCTYYFEITVLGICSYWIYRRLRRLPPVVIEDIAPEREVSSGL
jgi:uncharacterized protein (TIRG00374 family)